MRIPKSEYSLDITPFLRYTIKTLRKENNVRGDVLSQKMGRGVSYLYQIENGRIRELRLETLTQLLIAIAGIPESKFPEFIINLIDSIIESPDRDPLSLKNEEWIYIYDCKYRIYHIQPKLLRYLSKQLDERQVTPLELVHRMNTPNSPDAFSPPYNEPLKPLPILVKFNSSSSYTFKFSNYIHFRLDDDYVQQILDKKTTTITYTFMAGIFYYLFSDTMTSLSCLNKCHTILTRYGFQTIYERALSCHLETMNVLVENHVSDAKVKYIESTSFPPTAPQNKLETANFTTGIKTPAADEYIYYDTVPTSYSSEYKQLLSKIDDKFSYLFKKNETYAFTKVSATWENMENDPGLTTALMSSSIRSISPELRKDFWADYQALLNKYISKSEDK